MNIFSKTQMNGIEVRVFKIFTDSDASILNGRMLNNKIQIPDTNETYSVPKECGHFLWKEGLIKNNVYRCYIAVQGIKTIIDLKDMILLSEDYEKVQKRLGTKYSAEDVDSFFKTKIFSDFLNISGSIKWWLILGLLGGGIVIGFSVCMLAMISGMI